MSAPAGFINPQDAPYSAAGNGSTDDTTALNDALADCASQGKDLWCPRASGNYRITGTVTIPVGVNVESWADWEYDGTDGPAVVIGASGQHNEGVQVNIRVDILQTSSWTDANNIGIRALNCRGCWFRFHKAGARFPAGFYAAVNLHAESGLQCEGNIIELETCFYSRYKILCDGAGASRDNLAIGGRANVTTSCPSQQPAMMRCGPNARNNLWLNSYCEGTPSGSLHNPLMYMEGAYNEFRHGRSEMGNQDLGWGQLALDGAGATGNVCWPGQFQPNTTPSSGVLLNGAPSGVNAAIRTRDPYDGGADIDVIGGVN